MPLDRRVVLVQCRVRLPVSGHAPCGLLPFDASGRPQGACQIACVLRVHGNPTSYL